MTISTQKKNKNQQQQQQQKNKKTNKKNKYKNKYHLILSTDIDDQRTLQSDWIKGTNN